MKAIDKLKQRMKLKWPTLDPSRLKDEFLINKLRADKKALKETQLKLF